MFFEPKRLLLIRKLILSRPQQRQPLLRQLKSFQRQDFIRIFKRLKHHPIVVRLLDPPLHEFLPQSPQQLRALSRAMGVPFVQMQKRLQSLQEQNPMLGHRGARVGVETPSIYSMQCEALGEAAMATRNEQGLEIMLPFVFGVREFGFLRHLVQKSLAKVGAKVGGGKGIKIGAMLELPRAIMRAEALAAKSDFFSFGTNDLTQTALGLSRDDTARSMEVYKAHGLIDADPFSVLDTQGVGALVLQGVQGARRAKPRVSIGACGEHSGEARSIEFFYKAGLNYVSCSPPKVPAALLTVAQTFIKSTLGGTRTPTPRSTRS